MYLMLLQSVSDQSNTSWRVVFVCYICVFRLQCFGCSCLTRAVVRRENPFVNDRRILSTICVLSPWTMVSRMLRKGRKCINCRFYRTNYLAVTSSYKQQTPCWTEKESHYKRNRKYDTGEEPPKQNPAAFSYTLSGYLFITQMLRHSDLSPYENSVSFNKYS